MGRRELLLEQIRTLDRITSATIQLRFAAHGFKEQILAAGEFPVQLEMIKKQAAADLAAGAADVNASLARLKELSRPK